VPKNDEISDASRHTPLWREIAALAAAQHGVVSLTQLRALGMSASAVRDRVAAGNLHRIYRGVYAVGHPVLGKEGRWMAAALACGEGALLSHRSAAALWGIRPTSRSRIDVTLGRSMGRAIPGIEIHRSRTLRDHDGTKTANIPCTTPARTLLDVAEVVDRRGLERAVEQAEILRLLDLTAIDDVLARAAGRRGAPVLRAIVADHDPEPAPARNELERRFLELRRNAAQPSPRVNAWVTVEGDGFEVDFSWPDARLIVEVDGCETHGTRAAFERDRQRDRLLVLEGWHVVRFTWRQVVRRPGDVADTLRRLLAG
jgi:very-short-patch-repair endonuclease/predicted transcriptional regulator of viral defense system